MFGKNVNKLSTQSFSVGARVKFDHREHGILHGEIIESNVEMNDEPMHLVTVSHPVTGTLITYLVLDEQIQHDD